MPKARKSDSAKASSSSAAPRKSDAAPAAAQPLLAGYQPVSVGRHCIYLRAHDGGDGRTLFVVNLPSDTTERHLRHLFSAAGPVERVSFLGERPVAGSEELDEESEAEDEAMPAAAAEPSKGKGKAKKGYTKVVLNKAGPPAIVPLPPLDPRGVHRFHHTSTSAHVVFLDASSVARALALAPQKAWPEPWAQVEAAAVSLADEAEGAAQHKPRPRTGPEAALAAGVTAPPTGLAFLLARHAALRPPLSAVKTHVDSAVAHYAWVRAHPPPKRAGIEGVTVGPDGELLDADGFTIVQRGGKYGRTAEEGGGASMRVARPEQQSGTARPRKKKAKELEDFYRFQLREKKREGLAQMRAQFEADKEKVAKFKASRRFNPY